MISGPRILAGAWRGRKLVAPERLETRPTGARARQAVFDILMHAPWAGAEFLLGGAVFTSGRRLHLPGMNPDYQTLSELLAAEKYRGVQGGGDEPGVCGRCAGRAPGRSA